jgi:hypothetical protein
VPQHVIEPGELKIIEILPLPWVGELNGGQTLLVLELQKKPTNSLFGADDGQGEAEPVEPSQTNFVIV